MAKKDQRIEELEAHLMRALLRIEELERRLGKESHNSSKPPSSDSLGRKPGKTRKKSEKRLGAEAPAQYGSNVQSLAVHLSQFQLLPMARTCEVLGDLCQCTLSEATLVNWIVRAAKHLEPTIQWLKDLLIVSMFQHADETGIRIIRNNNPRDISGCFVSFIRGYLYYGTRTFKIPGRETCK